MSLFTKNLPKSLNKNRKKQKPLGNIPNPTRAIKDIQGIYQKPWIWIQKTTENLWGQTDIRYKLKCLENKCDVMPPSEKLMSLNFVSRGYMNVAYLRYFTSDFPLQYTYTVSAWMQPWGSIRYSFWVFGRGCIQILPTRGSNRIEVLLN